MKINNVWQGIFFSLIFTVTFLNNFLLNINKPLDLSHADISHISLILKHYFYIFQSGNFQDILTIPIFYGFKDSLLFSEHFFSYAVLGFPIYLFSHNINLVFNLLAVFSVSTSFFSMYLLTKYLTKRVLPSILASVIFAFNPFVMSHFPDQIIYYTLGWIPLIFLFIEKSFKNPTKTNTFLVFVFLTGQILTTMTFVAFLSIILPIYLLVRIWQLKVSIKPLINLGTILGIFLFGIVVLGLVYLYSTFYFNEPTGRDLTQTSFYSAWVSDYLFSPTTSLIYGGSRAKALGIMPDFIFDASETAEHNLFWGFIPTLLLLFSFKKVRKSPYRKYWLLCLGLLFLSVILSFGPYIHLTYNFYFSGLYGLLYAFNPLLQYLRVASRFGMFSYFFLGIIAAFVLGSMLKRLSKRMGYMVSVTLLILVLLEYWSLPLTFITIPQEIKQFYANLEQQKDIKVILELPMGNLAGGISQAKNQFVDANYMFYANNFHSKKLFNGYSSIIPAKYQKRQEYLSINFPTLSKLIQLKGWGVGGIILHRQEYTNNADFNFTEKGLEQLGVKKITETENLVLFDLSLWKEAP